MIKVRKVETLEGWEDLEAIGAKFNLLVHAVRQLQEILLRTENEQTG